MPTAPASARSSRPRSTRRSGRSAPSRSTTSRSCAIRPQLTIIEGLSYSSVAVMRQYAFLENHVGDGHGKQAVPRAVPGEPRDEHPEPVPRRARRLHPDLDAAHRRPDRADAAHEPARVHGRPGRLHRRRRRRTSRSCRTTSSRPIRPRGPVLIIAGRLDLIMPPAKEGSCIRDKLTAAGVDVDTCVISDADHSNIMEHHWKGLAWAESVMLAGGARTRVFDQLIERDAGLYELTTSAPSDPADPADRDRDEHRRDRERARAATATYRTVPPSAARRRA